MSGLIVRGVVSICLGAGWLLAAAANMGGTWDLNTQESKWGKKDPVPHEAKIMVEHHDPKLKYSGWVQGVTGPRNEFAFDGAIDNKEYPIENGTIRFRRLSSNSIESVQKSSDGTFEETAITSISSDGKKLTRRISSTGPHGRISWTEVYNKLQ